MLHAPEALRLRPFLFTRHHLHPLRDLRRLRQQTAMAATNGAIGAVNPNADKTLKLENVSDWGS